MARPIVLSNGQLFVGLDEHGLVHDFYYPYVGLDNLTNARSLQHKIGIWVDGNFSWIDDGSWQVALSLEADALISDSIARREDLGLELHFQDTIDYEHNAFMRHVTIRNLWDDDREVRLFMHQVFLISPFGRADTAMFVPEPRYILDYKGRYSLLINGVMDDGTSFDQYAVGNYGIEGKAGTFKDAEDGNLSENAVEHGGVDSVLRFRQTVPAQGEASVHYWVIAASSQSDAEVINNQLMTTDHADRLRQNRQHWQAWLQPAEQPLDKLTDAERMAVRHSALIIKAHCDERGSVLASGDSSIFNYGRDYYCYCWPRDAVYALWPLIDLGHFGEAKAFFEFARDTKHKDGYMMHKYQPDRAIGSTWHPLIHGRHAELAIQEDETAGVIFMIEHYLKASGDTIFVINFYHTFIQPCANWMAGFIDEATGLPHASYDLWEQKFLTNTYTVCTVIAGLRAAARLADISEQPSDASKWRSVAASIESKLDLLYNAECGYFRKGLLLQEDDNLTYDDTLDISSLYGLVEYTEIDLQDERIVSTLQQVEAKLLNSSPIGGVIRYPGDDYFLAKRQYGGNPWIVCSLWLAQVYISYGRRTEADQLIQWALDRQLPSGALSEQFDPDDGTSLGVAPLVWSHAELIRTILDRQG